MDKVYGPVYSMGPHSFIRILLMSCWENNLQFLICGQSINTLKVKNEIRRSRIFSKLWDISAVDLCNHPWHKKNYWSWSQKLCS